MSAQITNNYATAPTFPNPYISKKLNNMDQAQVMKKEREDWKRTYYKILKGLEAMIDIQRVMKDVKKLAEETSMTVAEIERMILTASINNRTTNAMIITQMTEDLWYLIQSDMDNRAFQIQRMLANELDWYKGRGNRYVEENIWEIQELYIKEENREEKEVVEEEEVILVKPYKVSTTTSSSSSTSFIMDKVKNFFKHMKFVWMPSQTRIFKPPPHYQSLKSRGE